MSSAVFVTPPNDFPRLAYAIERMLVDGIGKPPDLQDIGLRTYRAFMSGEFKGQNAKRRDWRNFPYAIWLSNGEGLFSETDLFRTYVNEYLLPSLNEARRPMKWARPLVFTYFYEFNKGNQLFEELASSTRLALKHKRMQHTESFQRLVDEFDVFDPERGPKSIAENFITSGLRTYDWASKNELWSDFFDSPFAQEAFLSALKVQESSRRSEGYVNALISWLQSDSDGSLRYPELRPQIAEALIMPWPQITTPPDLVKNRLIDFFKQHYGDPSSASGDVVSRLPRWNGVNPRCVEIILRWQAGEVLNAFFNVLQSTADEIWRYRQKFWKAYYDRGFIDEAWVALGATAEIYTRRYFSDKKLRYGHLHGSTDQNQSVLLLRMGHILFCEWSHNGKLRAVRVDAISAPKLYQQKYESDSLRFESLDFNSGQNQDPGLIHFSSGSGGWQDRARQFIRRQLGHNLMLSDVT